MSFMVKTHSTENGTFETKNVFFDDINLAIDFADAPCNHLGNHVKVFDESGRVVWEKNNPEVAEPVVVETQQEVVAEPAPVVEEVVQEVAEPVVEETTEETEEVVAEESTEEAPKKTRRKKSV